MEASISEVTLDPIERISGQGFLRAKVKNAGALVAYELAENIYRIIVWSDQWHFVTAHRITLGETPGIVHEGVLLQNGLKIPDGAAISPDHKWISITNHVHGEVLLFKNTDKLNKQSEPDARLTGLVCPHGVDFDPSGNIWVVDAPSPYLTGYLQPERGWSGMVSPSHTIRMMDNYTFYRGRYDAREGGIKGIYINPATEVVITTHKFGMLEFHDLNVLKTSFSPVDLEQLDHLQRERDTDVDTGKAEVMMRNWTVPNRLWEATPSIRKKMLDILSRVKPKLKKMRLHRINLNSQESIFDPKGPVVSMTTNSVRIQFVHLAIESIAQGNLKPRKMILRISDPEFFKSVPQRLRALLLVDWRSSFAMS
jgi:hypothetical protein